MILLAIPKKRRKKIYIILSKADNDAAILLLSKIWPIFEQSSIADNSSAAPVVDKVNCLYAIYAGTTDPDEFDACAATDIPREGEEDAIGELETAVTAWESAPGD